MAESSSQQPGQMQGPDTNSLLITKTLEYVKQYKLPKSMTEKSLEDLVSKEAATEYKKFVNQSQKDLDSVGFGEQPEDNKPVDLATLLIEAVVLATSVVEMVPDIQQNKNKVWEQITTFIKNSCPAIVKFKKNWNNSENTKDKVRAFEQLILDLFLDHNSVIHDIIKGLFGNDSWVVYFIRLSIILLRAYCPLFGIIAQAANFLKKLVNLVL